MYECICHICKKSAPILEIESVPYGDNVDCYVIRDNKNRYLCCVNKEYTWSEYFKDGVILYINKKVALEDIKKHNIENIDVTIVPVFTETYKIWREGQQEDY